MTLCSFYKDDVTFGSSIGDITFKMNQKMLLFCLEYYIQFWMPQMSMDYLENIYRRVERMVKPFVTTDGKRCFEEMGCLWQRENFVYICQDMGRCISLQRLSFERQINLSVNGRS